MHRKQNVDTTNVLRYSYEPSRKKKICSIHHWYEVDEVKICKLLVLKWILKVGDFSVDLKCPIVYSVDLIFENFSHLLNGRWKTFSFSLLKPFRKCVFTQVPLINLPMYGKCVFMNGEKKLTLCFESHYFLINGVDAKYDRNI